MEVAFALIAIAVVIFAVLHFTKRDRGDGPGASGPSGGNTRPGSDKL